MESKFELVPPDSTCPGLSRGPRALVSAGEGCPNAPHGPGSRKDRTGTSRLVPGCPPRALPWARRRPPSLVPTWSSLRAHSGVSLLRRTPTLGDQAPAYNPT